MVYSYRTGWSNASIPDLKFDGLFPAFALLRQGADGGYYTDYSRSGNFQKWDGSRNTWNNWWLKYWASGSRAYLSYGGGTNDELRGMIINASDYQLDRIAGEIKANIYQDGVIAFDGVDLDIETWWSHTKAENEKFALQLAKLVKILRKSLDSNPTTFLKPIMITVAHTAAYTQPTFDTYAGTMNLFFSDKEAMNAISAVNIMSYGTHIPNFYTRLDIIDVLLNEFKTAGVPAEKLILGVQACESGAAPPPHTPLEVITNLGQYIKQGNYGGVFLWGIGAAELCGQNPEDYLKAMKNGLGLN